MAHCRGILEAAPWVDGRTIAGAQAALAKNKLQVPENMPTSRELGDVVLRAGQPPYLQQRRPAAAGLSADVQPVRRRDGVPRPRGQCHPRGTGAAMRVRADVSPTLFLTPPEEYEGGELVIQDSYGERAVKLAAGDLVVYSATSLHHVRPITHGSRWGGFFWTQSMVKDDGQRSLLFDLDMGIIERRKTCRTAMAALWR